MLEFSPDGSYMAIRGNADDKPLVQVRPVVAGGRAPVDIPLPAMGAIRALAMSVDNRRLAIGGDRQIVRWDLERNKAAATIKLDSAVKRIAFHPSRPLMASAQTDGSVRLWSTLDGRSGESFPAVHADGAHTVAFDPAGALMVSGGEDGPILVYDLRRPRVQPIPLPASGKEPPPVKNLVFVGGSGILAGGQLDGPKDLWDLVRRQHLGRVGGNAEDLQAVAISPRGRRLALKQFDGTASLYDWNDAKLNSDACAIAGRNLSCKEWQQTFREEPYRKTCPPLPEPDPPCAAPAARAAAQSHASRP
jgi:WD40 repeat protein